MHGLQAVRVELGLLSTLGRVDGGLLRLHHRQRLAVISPQDVIGVTDPRGVRHARELVLTDASLAEGPAGPLQGQVDDQPAGRALAPVAGLGDGLVLCLDGGEPLAQRLQLAFEVLARVLGGVQVALEGVQFLDAGGRGAGSRRRDQGLVEGLPLEVLRPFPQIGAARPVEDVRQFPDDVQGVLRRGRLVAVHRDVARLADVLRLLPHRLGQECTKRWLTEVGVQVRDLRRAQGLLELVDAFDQALQRMPCVGSRRLVVAVNVVLREGRALRRMRELLLQEREVGGDFHGGSEVSPEGTGLQGGEEVVELGEVGSLLGLLTFDGFDDGGEPILE